MKKEELAPISEGSSKMTRALDKETAPNFELTYLIHDETKDMPVVHKEKPAQSKVACDFCDKEITATEWFRCGSRLLFDLCFACTTEEMSKLGDCWIHVKKLDGAGTLSM